MDLSDIDRLIADRKKRIDKRKEEGTLFEEEFSKPENEDERLAKEIEDQKKKELERYKKNPPPCPQCGYPKMTYIAEENAIACPSCGVAMHLE